MEKDNIMEVFDEKGNKTEMTILFTTTLDNYGKNYIFYINEKANDGQVYVSSFDDSGKLEPVTDEEEWNQLNEVFEQFMEEKENSCEGCSKEECEGCEGNCNK